MEKIFQTFKKTLWVALYVDLLILWWMFQFLEISNYILKLTSSW